jgi:hypothetical protein
VTTAPIGEDEIASTEPASSAAPTDVTAATVSRQRPDGPDAPEFVLSLGQGGEFSPSGEAKPIYIIFWAEW